MKRSLIIIILLFILAAEGVAMELLPSAIKYSSLYITPHWILLILILVVTYMYPNDSFIPVVYAASFGLINDIVYTGVLGVYMFVLAMSVYIAQLLSRVLQTSFLPIILIASIGVLTMELGLFAIYSLLGISMMSLQDYLVLRCLPTLIANLFFIIVVFYPGRKLLSWMGDGEFT